MFLVVFWSPDKGKQAGLDWLGENYTLEGKYIDFHYEQNELVGTSPALKYGGDGSGSYLDKFAKGLYEVNQLNPVAGAFNLYSNYRYGSDIYGNRMSKFDVGMAVVGVIPYGKVAGVAAKGGEKGGLNLFKFGSKEATSSAGWKSGDRFLKMFDQGSPKLNWKQNSGFLRGEMNLGKPIFDSYRLPNGNLIPTRGFLNAERNLLQSRGWLYNSGQVAWLPTIK